LAIGTVARVGSGGAGDLVLLATGVAIRRRFRGASPGSPPEHDPDPEGRVSAKWKPVF